MGNREFRFCRSSRMLRLIAVHGLRHLGGKAVWTSPLVFQGHQDYYKVFTRVASIRFEILGVQETLHCVAGG